MAKKLLNILVAGDPVLRKVAEPVTRIDKKLHRLLKDMADTMYASDGVGLAAPQIGVSKRIVVIDVGLINTQQAAALRSVEVVCIAAVLTQGPAAITGVVRGPDPLAAVRTNNGLLFQAIRAEVAAIHFIPSGNGMEASAVGAEKGFCHGVILSCRWNPGWRCCSGPEGRKWERIPCAGWQKC